MFLFSWVFPRSDWLVRGRPPSGLVTGRRSSPSSTDPPLPEHRSDYANPARLDLHDEPRIVVPCRS